MKLLLGNCLDEMRKMPDNSVDSVVTDPPYGLAFMNKKWDYDVPSEEIWKECLRVLKPGGHLLAFAGTRTQHRMAVRIEDAGFEIRDMIGWVYGQGFPKSLNIGKAIDKELGAEREVVGKTSGMGKQNPEWNGTAKGRLENSFKPEYDLTVPSTDEAKKYEGWSTALKPAMEPITVARKPIEENTVAANVLKYGTGGINIDECRIDLTEESLGRNNKEVENGWKNSSGGKNTALLNEEKTKSGKVGVVSTESKNVVYGKRAMANVNPFEGNSGSAARFFYCAKASKKDRDEGCENRLEDKNIHPTVKPTDLMRYLCRLVTPKNGIVLDPFMGSGSTGKAALLENFDFIGVEMDENYFRIAEARINHIAEEKGLELF